MVSDRPQAIGRLIGCRTQSTVALGSKGGGCPPLQRIDIRGLINRLIDILDDVGGFKPDLGLGGVLVIIGAISHGAGQHGGVALVG
jgi:hypothetical protein